jgi:hypothetical protein
MAGRSAPARPLDHVAVDRQVAFDAAAPGEAPRPGGAQLGALGTGGVRQRQHLLQRRKPRVEVQRRIRPGEWPHQVDQAADRTEEDRRARGLCFDGGKAEAFVQRRVDGCPRTAVEGHQFAVLQEGREVNATAQGFRDALQRQRAGAETAADEMQVVAAATGKKLQRPVETLALLGAAQIQQIGRTTQRLLQAGRQRHAGIAEELIRDAVRHDGQAVCQERPTRGNVAARGFTDGDDRRTAAKRQALHVVHVVAEQAMGLFFPGHRVMDGDDGRHGLPDGRGVLGTVQQLHRRAAQLQRQAQLLPEVEPITTEVEDLAVAQQSLGDAEGLGGVVAIGRPADAVRRARVAQQLLHIAPGAAQMRHVQGAGHHSDMQVHGRDSSWIRVERWRKCAARRKARAAMVRPVLAIPLDGMSEPSQTYKLVTPCTRPSTSQTPVSASADSLAVPEW